MSSLLQAATDRQTAGPVPSTTVADVEGATLTLLAYCRADGWAGYDPYDALNSPLFRTVPLLDYRWPRLVCTQLLKRSPVDCRRLLRIPKTQNPKAIALFLSAFIALERVNGESQQGDIDHMIERLRMLRSPGTNYWCWGYSFPWQGRTVLVPTGTPNLVCTFFVANSLFEAFDRGRDSQCLGMALSAAEYILNELYWTEGDVAGFSYPLPFLRSQVHNANLLAAALLCRAYRHTGDERFILPALRVARYAVTKQQADGSWLYGEDGTDAWIDNFHTGYNLCALQSIARYANTTEFDPAIRRGFEFYRSHFFQADGSVKYFHDRKYPIDVHCVAQSIITLVVLRDLDAGNLLLAHSVLRWALAHLWDYRGFFYYRILRSCTNRISYMRWSQAWMLLGMGMFLEAFKGQHSLQPAIDVLGGSMTHG